MSRTPATAPPIRGATDLPAPPAHQPPLSPTSLIGHEQQIAELERLLAETRRLALTGQGGTGKVRLALEVLGRAGAALASAEGAGMDVRVCALGPLEIELNGTPAAGAFNHSRPRELFLYLLCHPEGRTREQVGLALWPDAAGKQLKNNFHVALHHLRKALGHPDWITLDGERYRIAPVVRVWFDAAVFEREIVAGLRDRGGEGTERLARALDLYRGAFLTGEPVGDWHLQFHDRLRRLCVDGRFELGRRLMKAERLTEAAEAFQHLLHLEDLHEEACRRLMVCEARLGARTEALRRYGRLVLQLRDELGAEPEPETVRLYDRLRRAEPV